MIVMTPHATEAEVADVRARLETTAVVAMRDSLFMGLAYPSRRLDDRDDTAGVEG